MNPHAECTSRNTAPQVAGALSPALVLLFAIAGGLSVANIYFVHPLLDAISRDLSIDAATIGIVVTLTQIGYALGLIFIVPLGDVLDRRKLIAAQGVLTAIMLLVVGFASHAAILLAGVASVGLLAVVVQVLVAFAATLAQPEERGRVVGSVTSGIVLGILAARFVSGVFSDLWGWRSVYFFSAGLTLAIAMLLFRALPQSKGEPGTTSYGRLVASVWRLFVEEPVLRVRAAFAFFIFTAFSALWTSMVLPLTVPPHSLSHTQVGMFGLAGVVGAVAAGRAGRFADQGRGQWVTGIALTLLLVSWIPIALVGSSLALLVFGVVLLDFAVQSVHVVNQSLIFAIRPEARSRTVGGYMVFYSIGSATGSIVSTVAYAHYGWLGVCLFGGIVSAIALVFWAVGSTQ